MTAPALPRQGRPEPPGRPHITRQAADQARTAIRTLEGISRLVTRSLLTIGGGALVFTCVNVTLFGMSHGIPWWIAWMLDPLASLALITVLYVDGVLAEHDGYKPGGWPFLLRWTAGLSTWLMNCWTSLYPDGHFQPVPQHPDAGGILLHSVAPVLLILLSEAATGYRKYLSRRRSELTAIITAYEAAQASEREAAAERDRAERANEQNMRREREEREVRDRAERERREHETRLENERIRAQAEAERVRKAAEIEAEREALRLAREREEIEETRRRRETELEQQARDREAERQKALILARGDADAARTKADAEAKVLEETERLKRQRALERAAARTRVTVSHSASQNGDQSSESASQSRAALVAVSGSPASESEGRIPREVRARQRDDAERYVAKCFVNRIEPDLDGLAKHYGKGETWVGDRVRAARVRLEQEPGFKESVAADDTVDGFVTDDSDATVGAA